MQYNDLKLRVSITRSPEVVENKKSFPLFSTLKCDFLLRRATSFYKNKKRIIRTEYVEVDYTGTLSHPLLKMTSHSLYFHSYFHSLR